ncbi:hypothetical protein B0H14DRAFT_2599030 [Mycena olivaceomarginata]|nr:hypothetical protein B0H14DRAFT_2599030 [Mycena olivaceomarginata]
MGSTDTGRARKLVQRERCLRHGRCCTVKEFLPGHGMTSGGDVSAGNSQYRWSRATIQRNEGKEASERYTFDLGKEKENGRSSEESGSPIRRQPDRRRRRQWEARTSRRSGGWFLSISSASISATVLMCSDESVLGAKNFEISVKHVRIALTKGYQGQLVPGGFGSIISSNLGAKFKFRQNPETYVCRWEKGSQSVLVCSMANTLEGASLIQHAKGNVPEVYQSRQIKAQHDEEMPSVRTLCTDLRKARRFNVRGKWMGDILVNGIDEEETSSRMRNAPLERTTMRKDVGRGKKGTQSVKATYLMCCILHARYLWMAHGRQEVPMTSISSYRYSSGILNGKEEALETHVLQTNVGIELVVFKSQHKKLAQSPGRTRDTDEGSPVMITRKSKTCRRVRKGNPGGCSNERSASTALRASCSNPIVIVEVWKKAVARMDDLGRRHGCVPGRLPREFAFQASHQKNYLDGVTLGAAIHPAKSSLSRMGPDFHGILAKILGSPST